MNTNTTNIATALTTDGKTALFYATPLRFKGWDGKMHSSTESVDVMVVIDGKKKKVMGNVPVHLLNNREYFLDWFDSDNVTWFLPEAPVSDEVIDSEDDEDDDEEEVYFNEDQLVMEF
jgi:hypothetical protein